MAVSFPGGKKLRNRRKPTCNTPVRHLPSCSEYTFPLSQSMSEPLKPLVQAGDWVRVGQKIADLDDYLAVPVHSSVSGAVIKTDDNTITIESDGQYNAVKTENTDSLPLYTTRELLWLIRDAGITEPSGEPAHVKLNPQKSIKYIIANCAESDLYVTSKQRLTENHSADIVAGLKIAMRILNLKESYIGVEAHMKGCFNKLKKEIRYDTSIHLLKMKSKYPQSDETQMIRSVTGLDTPIGSVVIDARTLYDISLAVNRKKSVTERIVTVSGDAAQSPTDFIVPLGAPVSFLIEQAGGISRENAQIVIGGGIKRINVPDDAFVTKNIDAVLALSEPKPDNPHKSCGLCVKCIPSCPMRINPRLLSSVSSITTLEDNFILDCTECGLCSYICPKRRNPMKRIKEFKSLIEQQKKSDRF